MHDYFDEDVALKIEQLFSEREKGNLAESSSFIYLTDFAESHFKIQLAKLVWGSFRIFADHIKASMSGPGCIPIKNE